MLVGQASDLLVGEPLEGGTFELLREPSGVIALDDNTLIVVEDESRHALHSLERKPGNASFEFTEFEQASGTGFIQRRLIGALNDLEGVARLSDERFFVIGSHENASRGETPSREKLVLFTREGKDRSSLWVLPLTGSVNPVHIPSTDNDLFDDVEGLTPIADRILFVRDTGGGKSNRNQLWFTLSRSQLGLDE